MENSAYGCVPFPFSIFRVKLDVPEGVGAVVELQLLLVLLMRSLYSSQDSLIAINDAKMRIVMSIIALIKHRLRMEMGPCHVVRFC